MRRTALSGAAAAAFVVFAAPAALAAQASTSLPAVGPMSMSTFVGTYLNPALNSLAGCNSGPSAPANGPGGAPVQFECWVNTSASPYAIKLYDGASWVTIGYLNASSHAWTPAGAATQACDTLEAHGGGTGVADNKAALVAAFAALPAAGGCIEAGAGTYTFTTAPTLTFPSSKFSLELRGRGQGATTLTFTNGVGITFGYNDTDNSAYIHDASILTGTAGAGEGLKWTQSAGGGIPPVTTLERLKLAGTTVSKYWTYAVDTNGVTNFDASRLVITGDGTHGAGFLCQGTGTANYSELVSLKDSTFSNLAYGALMGSYCQAFNIDHLNVVGGVFGVYAAGAELGVLTDLKITNSDISLQTNAAISLNTNVVGLVLSGNYLWSPASVVNTQFVATNFQVTGNHVECASTTGSYGVVPLSGASIGTVTGNTIDGCGAGVLVSSGATNVNVQANAYSGNTTNAANFGGTSNSLGVATQ